MDEYLLKTPYRIKILKVFIFNIFFFIAALSSTAQTSVSTGHPATTYMVGQPGVVIAPNITVTAAGTISNVKISIETVVSGDVLNVSLLVGYSQSWNSTTKILTITTYTGSGSASDYQTMLRTATFYTTNTTSPRRINFIVADVVTLEIEGKEHVYELVNNGSPITWSAAKSAAESRTIKTSTGATEIGYLATITSAEENAFIAAKVSSNTWLGASDNYAYTPEANGSDEGKWYWVTGPENGTQFWSGNGSGTPVGGEYNRWYTGEPNDAYSTIGEDFMHMYGGTGGSQDGYWNDFYEGTVMNVSYYLVEYGGYPSSPTTIVASDYVDITITTNNPPVANNLGPYSVGTGNSYNGNMSGSDPDGDSFTYVKYDGPTRGTLSYNSSTGSFTYTAPSDYVGSTSFRYRTHDGKVYSGIATVSFTVSDDDNPIARTKNISVNLNSSGNATITASDVNNGSSDNIGITGLSVSPAAFDCDNLGQNTVTLTVYDAAGNSDSETATVTVNDPFVPVANDDEYSIYYSETGNITYTLTVNSKEGVLANDTDVLACNGLTVNAVTNNPAHGSLIMNMANGSFTFKPAINYKGDDTFKYTATDGDNVSSEATVTIHIVTPTFTNDGGDGLFSNPANWNCGYVPDAESLDLIIEAAGLIIDQDYTCRNLQFLAGSSFSCNGGKLTITGNVLNRFGQVAIGISSSMVVSSSISINNE